MRLLLDTHVLVALVRPRRREHRSDFREILSASDNATYFSAASLWEIAIKARLGRLEIDVPLDDLASFFQTLKITLLVIDHRHVVRLVVPEPATRDPFDRLLLAQCAVEDMKLLTSDHSLVAHPLAYRTP